MNLATATIGQLSIPVQDFDRGLAFYRDVLGLPFLFAAPPQMAFFQCGDIRVLVGASPAKAAGHAAPALYFRVDDIQAAHSTLAAQGVAFGSPPHAVHKTATSTLWLAEFADPDGNALALMCDVPASAA